METKNTILVNYVVALSSFVNTLDNVVKTLTNDNASENSAILKTVNVIIDSIKSQTINIQNAIDNYNE